MTTPAAAAAATPATEYTIRCPKNTNKKLHVMRFASERDLDFKKWTNVKMERENNMREFKGMEEDQPKFGAGSEFGRDQREEARRKKLGIVSRKYRQDDQPWLLKVGGKTGRKYKGIRDGGIADNAAYYVFTHAPGGHIEAYPLLEWYNFIAIQRFKPLTAEEAEEVYSKRNKTIDFFSLMMRKRLRGDTDDADEDSIKEEKKKGKAKKDFTISEMDEWMESSEDDESGDEEKEEEKEDKKKKKKQVGKDKKKKKKGSDDEAIEESDDGDEEGREHEYISDSSSSESEHEGTKQLKGVAEEDALRKLLTSDEDSEDEEKKDEDKKDDETKGEEDEEKASKLNKKSKKKVVEKKESKESSSDMSSNSEDEEKEKKPLDEPVPAPQEQKPVVEKRKAGDGTPPSSPPLKKPRPEGANDSMEEAVRRYLTRKPMTTTELLQKFKSKKTGMSSEQLLKLMTQILKRINPVRQTIKGKMYLSIKK